MAGGVSPKKALIVGFKPVLYLGAGDPPVKAWAKQASSLTTVTTAFEGEVAVRPGDWLVRDNTRQGELSVWPRETFKEHFDLDAERAS